MDFTKGYTASFYGCYIDPLTWLDQERFELVDGSVSRTNEELRQGADLTVRDFDEDAERWIRIYMDAEQDGNRVHVPLFTGIATSPKRDIEGSVIEKEIECYSVLKCAEDMLLQRGWYVPARANSETILRELLNSVPAPLRVNGIPPRILEAIVAEDNETYLSMIDSILDAINWKMQIAGDGTIILSPVSFDPAATFSAKENDVLETSLTIARDWFNCPNVLRATSGDLTAVARDDSQTSPLSTFNRGREIWVADDEAELNADESITEYAARKLAEEQQVEQTASYTRRFLPDINVGDIVQINYDQIDGRYIVTEQDIELTHNATTNEEVAWLGA